MKTVTKATNAQEAKIITDKWLSKMHYTNCVRFFRSKRAKELGVEIHAYRKAYEIGACSYYYGSECKNFPSDIIMIELTNKIFDHVKKETV